MSVKLLIAYFILLTPLDSVCDRGLPITSTGTNTTSGHPNLTDPTVFYSTHPAYENSSKGHRGDHSSNSTLNNSDQSDSQPDFYDYEYEFYKYNMASFALAHSIFAVASLGVCGNVIVLLVWSAETVFNPTTFLMKCLAVSDIVLLLVLAYNLINAFYLFAIPAWMGYVIYVTISLMFYLRMVTAHTTLGVVVTRWVAVHKPLRVQSLLTKRRVVASYVLMLFWCLTPAVLVGLLLSGYIDDEHGLTMLNIGEGVYLVLPILLVVVLNMSLVYTLCSHRHSSSLGPQQQQRAARAARSLQLQQLVKAVLCLSVTTVLAYPVGMAYRVLLNVHSTVCSTPCLVTFLFASIVLEEVNSSINVIYYLLFISRFRQLFRRRCCCCWS